MLASFIPASIGTIVILISIVAIVILGIQKIYFLYNSLRKAQSAKINEIAGIEIEESNSEDEEVSSI